MLVLNTIDIEINNVDASDHASFIISLKVHRRMSVMSPNIAPSKATVSIMVLKHDSDFPL